MKIIASVCAGIALVAGIVALNLRLELRKEREVAAVLQGRSTQGQPPASRLAAPPPDATVAAATAADMPISGQLKDPEYRKLQLKQLRASIEDSYPSLAQELDLSKDEAERLFDLLAENQLAKMADGSLPTTLDGQGNPETLRSQWVLEREQEESILALLGGRYAQWQAYQQTLPIRFQVTAMITQFAPGAKPLTATQKRQLTTALIAERQRQTQEEKFMPQTFPGNPADPKFRAQMMEESLKRTEENNRRILETATPYIDATQLAALRAQLKRQTSMNQQMLRTQTELLREQAQPRQ